MMESFNQQSGIRKLRYSFPTLFELLFYWWTVTTLIYRYLKQKTICHLSPLKWIHLQEALAPFSFFDSLGLLYIVITMYLLLTPRFLTSSVKWFWFLFLEVRHWKIGTDKVCSMEFLHSFLRSHSRGNPKVVSWNVGCFLRLGMQLDKLTFKGVC